MAAAEARASWQRRASSRLVEEDARRGLRSSGYSSSSSTPCSDGRLGDSEIVPDNIKIGHVGPSSTLSVPNDINWWLHFQCGFVQEKDSTYDQTLALEAELEILNAENQSTKHSADDEPVEVHCSQADVKTEAELCTCQSANCMKNGWDMRIQELKAVHNSNLRSVAKRGMGVLWHSNDHCMGLDCNRSSGCKQDSNLSSDLEQNLIGVEKAEPWWRTADRDELASLVAQKSLEHVENCDLPQPQIKPFQNGLSSCLEYSDHYRILASSLNPKAKVGSLSFACQENPPLVRSNAFRHSPNVSRPPLSINGCIITNGNMDQTKNCSEGDPSKAQLLEALCHSQTRARKAEETALQLQTEKEHIIKLFFKQASQLFAYKQWLRLLQLEDICLQVKSKDGPTSDLFPVALPRVPDNDIQPRKCQFTPAGGKQSLRKRKVRKSAMAFAVGLSLVGAGLLLGWTMGCLLPAL